MKIQLFLLFFIECLIWCSKVESHSKFYEARKAHRALELSDNEVNSIASRTDLIGFENILDEILIPRVVGTLSHTNVANFIVNKLESLGWDTERDKFIDRTPVFGDLEFENIIGKLNPHADRYLVLACHYDSKYVREFNFVGATDSAVPCAMMLYLAEVLKNELNIAKNNANISLAFIFFDGEEAFRQWTSTDSIYGARHLAKKWEQNSFKTSSNDVTTHLDRIDILVLLDLLGAKNPKFYSYFSQTEDWYIRLANIEQRLARMRLLQRHTSNYFIRRNIGAHIEDDHVPFLKRDVKVLHIIPTPFPDVWHKQSDNKSVLDMNTIENLNKIFRIFVAEYLHLNI